MDPHLEQTIRKELREFEAAIFGLNVPVEWSQSNWDRHFELRQRVAVLQAKADTLRWVLIEAGLTP